MAELSWYSKAQVDSLLATKAPVGSGSGSGGSSGRFDVTSAPYSAVGNGTTIDRAAIQAAINAANAAYVQTGTQQEVYFPPKVFLVDAVDYVASNNAVFGAVSLMLLDGVTLVGPGTIKVKSGAYGNGALYAVIRSKDSLVSHAAIRGVTIDGNRAGNIASKQCSNIVLEANTDVTIDNVKSLHANGNGIMVRGTTSFAATNIRIANCDVEDCSAIGIQSSQFNGLTIADNVVNGSSDNSIDVYGENGTVNSNGLNFSITGNHCFNGLVGIFLESVAQGVISGNFTSNCTATGVHVNRINSQPNSLNIVANTFMFGPNGAQFTGDTGGVTFRNNVVFGTSGACVQLGGAGNVSYIFILDNSLDTRTQNGPPLVSIASGTNQSAFNRHRGTITLNTNRSLDTVTNATTSVGNNYSAANAL